MPQEHSLSCHASQLPDRETTSRTARACAVVVTLGVLLFVPQVWSEENDPVDLVDPFIGTGGHGHTYPGATRPFGMVQLSPDTRLEGWDGCSGYHDSDDVVYGFSHTHLSGTGVGDYGDILFMPVTGTPLLDNGYGADPATGYASRFFKRRERAGAGWYSVALADYGILVELTATKRTGFHRYHYPAGRPAHVIVDLTHRDEVVESAIRVVGDDTIEGFRRSTGWARDQVVHFVAQFSKPFDRAALANHDVILPGVTFVEGRSVKGVLAFGDAGGELLVKVGISAVDVEGARRNLMAESPGWEFDAVREAARESWNAALRRIEIHGGTDEHRIIFNTALYHSLLAPNLFSDVDGRYRGIDRRIHHADGRQQYTVFSLWDTFRATHPLFTLIEPQRTREFIETMLSIYEQGGRLPVWELAANETDTMIGYHSVSVIADAWLKGIRDFDELQALTAMVDGASRDHFGLEAYKRQGFIGSEDDGESVSKTLEYAYDDWCIARMAEEVDREAIAGEFYRRSQAWRHLLDPQTGFMRPRRNQQWLEPFDPRRVDNNYTEANAWQYSFFVPHDVEGLIETLGGEERFVERLDELFTADNRTTGRDQADITGLIGQYAHGNEPSHHMAWLYHYAGRPDKSSEMVHRIIDTLYAADPDGLSGNEDCGQMSSWFVFAALGLYPVAPCSPDYLLIGPVFDRSVLNLESGRRFEIRVDRTAAADRYITAATLNGEPLSRSYLKHGEIASGGELQLVLGPRPNPDWGTSRKDRPRSRVEAPRVLAAPFAHSDGDRFRDQLTVELAAAEAGATIRYRKEDGRWRKYRKRLVLKESTTIRFVVKRDGLRSPVVEAYFHRIPNDWAIEVAGVPNPQYTAGGPEALIDGLRGDREWRTGGWQGFQYGDFEATVDFGRSRPLRRAGASFLQDARSWIWMPAEVVLSVSTDGENYNEVARLASGVPDDEDGVILRDVVADLEGIQARYLRIVARNYGTIPDWHPGRGGGAFIFVDEILAE
jgi:predicted alpha-1,2-mannosidase